MNYEMYLAYAEKWARHMGGIQLESFRSKQLIIEKKSTAVDLVTEVDKACEAYIINEIKRLFPSHDILSEESGMHDNASDFLWIVDPLDGTTNYAQGIPVFSVSIALIHKGDRVVGCIYQPILDEMFTAIKGSGAYLNNKHKLQVSKKTKLIDSILVTGFPYDKGDNPINNADFFAAFVPKVRGIRRYGSAAYDLANVAAGFIDGFWELDLSPWDVEAGILLIEEAGGMIERLEAYRGVSIIAGSKELCKEIKDVIKGVKV